MNNDFDLIVKKFPKTWSHINVYPLGDLHVGSEEFDMEKWRKWKQMVLDDPFAVVVTVGDLLDNGLKSSITNVYEQTMRPWDQKRWLANELKPLKDKILVSVQGNHEYRTTKTADGCPMYDVMAKMDLEHLYRANMGFLKICVGEKSHDRQFTYTLVMAHGSSKFKTRVFSYAIDGMDVFVTGHIHQGGSAFPAKIVIDSKNETVKMRGFTTMTVTPFLRAGGYGLKALYEPQDHSRIPILRLSGEKKEVSVLWV